jgi:hypothetical protein
MGRLFVVCLAAALLGAAVHADAVVQTSWYLGPGVQGPVSSWGEYFWSSQNVAYSVPGKVSLLAEFSNNEAWTRHVIDGVYGIDGHANIIPVDINGDGYLDLVAAIGLPVNQVVWYEYTATGYVRHNVGAFASYIGTTWPCDLDGDGDIDIVASGEEGLIWFRNEGGGAFTKIAIDVSMGYLYARPGDVDNDGDMDIVVHDKSYDGVMYGDLWLFRNNGAMTFVPEKIFNVTKSDIWRINVGDLNGDGYLDIQTSGEPLHVFLNDGTGVFWLKYTMDDTIHIDGSWLSDFDADGDLDIMSANWGYVPYFPRGLFWLENDGSGTMFTSHPIGGDDGKYGDGGMATDVNLDGLMDALGSYEKVGWFEQVPGGTFLEHQVPNGWISSSHWIYGENLDGGPCSGDVDIDMLVTTYDTFYWWENRMISFYRDGELVSSILDAQKLSLWTTFGWDDCAPRGTQNEYYVRVGKTAAQMESLPWIGPLASSDDSLNKYGVPEGQFFQYMLVMKNVSAADDISPSVNEVWVNFVEKKEITPLGLKQNVVAALDSLKPQTKGTIKKLKEAKKHVLESLAPELWVDERHLSPRRGEKVFYHEKKAVSDIEKLCVGDKCKGVISLSLIYHGSGVVLIEAKSNGKTCFGPELVAPGSVFDIDAVDEKLGTETEIWVEGSLAVKIHTSCSRPLDEGMLFGDFEVESVDKIAEGKGEFPNAVCQRLIGMLVRADSTLARIAIDEAKAANGNPKEIKEAEKEFAKALQELAKGHPKDAIEHFKHAWEHAMKALRVKGPKESGEMIWNTGSESGTRLLQNRPNPARSSTCFEFILAGNGSARLAVYDVAGREVWDSTFSSPGLHSVEWNCVDTSGRPVSSGVYIYRLEAPGFSQAGRMAIIK